jgi:transposase
LSFLREVNLRNEEESDMNITRIGLDIAKNVFCVVGVDASGKVLLSKKLNRNELLRWFSNIAVCEVGIEACAGAHHWARALQGMGFDVRLIAAQHVKRYRIAKNKNDANDAYAICETMSRPGIPRVSINPLYAQDQQMLVRIRALAVAQRTALVNQIRGLLGEYGLVVAQGIAPLRGALAQLLAQEASVHGLSALAMACITDCQAQLSALDKRIAEYDQRVAREVKASAVCKRVLALPGLGPLGALTLSAALTEPLAFKNGRSFAASLGLTPREHSSGQRHKLMGISKQGNSYLRMLLVHGARAVISALKRKPRPEQALRNWAKRLALSKGCNVAAVALANKLARIAWALLAHQREFSAHWHSGATAKGA